VKILENLTAANKLMKVAKLNSRTQVLYFQAFFAYVSKKKTLSG
jgi:hypothetical protein